MGTDDILVLGVTLRWTSIPSRGGGGVEILLVASYYRNQDKLRLCGRLWLVYDFTLFLCRMVLKGEDIQVVVQSGEQPETCNIY